MAQLPAPLRAAFGLVGSVADVVKGGPDAPDNLGDRLLELPVLAVSTVLRLSLRAQQQYAALTVRGDELLTSLRGGPSDEPPAWAQFDDDPPPPATPSPAKQTPTIKVPAIKVPAIKVPAIKAPAKKVPAKKIPVERTAAARKVSAPRTGKPSAFDQAGDES